MHKGFIFGIGLKIDNEFQFSEEIVIRPAILPTDHIKLQEYARSRIDYGFLVALAEAVSFEVEIAGQDNKSTAINMWNHQWLLILLSIVVRAPIYHPISSTVSSQELRKNCCSVQNVFLGPAAFNSRISCSLLDLEKSQKLYENFRNLLSKKSFSHATSIAAHNFNEPKKSIRMAAIWSGIEALLNVESELNYRIPLLCALLLGNTEEERFEVFSRTQKLYAARSKCVHGAAMKDKDLDQGLNESLKLLCDLILLFSKRGSILDSRELKHLPLNLK